MCNLLPLYTHTHTHTHTHTERERERERERKREREKVCLWRPHRGSREHLGTTLVPRAAGEVEDRQDLGKKLEVKDEIGLR